MRRYDFEDYRNFDESMFDGDIRYEQWKSFNFCRQMLEWFGEATHVVKCLDDPCCSNELDSQFDTFERLCAYSIADPKNSDGEKYSVLHAFLDIEELAYSPSPPTRCKDTESAMRWFYQWVEPVRMKIAFES